MMIKLLVYNLSRLSAAFPMELNKSCNLKSKGIAKTAELTKRATLLVFFYLLLGSAYANNIRVTNASLVDINTTSDIANVRFDLTWENSWRVPAAPSNWDAAWVFVKYRVGTGPWMHAFLNDTGHTAGTGTGTTISAGLVNTGLAFNSTSNPAVGVFIHRSAAGTGTFTQTGIKLGWNYGANGVSDYSVVEIKVFAIEMVYVAQGAFAAGSGGSGIGEFILTTINTSVANTAPAGTGSLGGQAGGYPTGQTAPNAAWPNGFRAIYMMKYSITQQQYVDFLNTLTREQQNTRTLTDLSIGITSVLNRYVMSNTSTIQNRNGIRINATIHTSDPLTFYCDLNDNGIGTEANDGQWIACNYFNWMDGAAYMDWSGLRFMTELEYEKAARGPLPPIANEFAWGTNQISTDRYPLTNIGAADEHIASNYNSFGIVGNASYGSTTNFDVGIDGPLRVGIFAGNAANSGRVSSGASYWGVMELSGNLWERTVAIGDEAGRNFGGLHGDGTLSVNGYADVVAWPGLVAGEVTGANGAGFRGGVYTDASTRLYVSDRTYATNSGTGRGRWFGFRGVRTAP